MPIVEALPESALAMDTNVFTWVRKDNLYIKAKIGEYIIINKQPPALPAITVFEALFGIEKAYESNKITEEEYLTAKSKIDFFTNLHTILDYNLQSSKIAAFICAKLGKRKSGELWDDIQIVATVLAHNYGLASSNKKDMEAIASVLPAELILRLAVWKPNSF